jgi:hypothetical protein
MRVVKDDAFANLLEQYKGSITLKKVIEIFCKQIQQLEENAEKNYFINDIETATGSMLDRIGEIVNQKRLGFSDSFYRTMLKCKIASLYSDGTRQSILSIWSIIQPFGSFFIIESQGSIWIYTDTMFSYEIYKIIKQNIEKALPIGVKFGFLVFRPSINTFKFSNNSESKFDSNKGFDSGNLSYIIYSDYEESEITTIINGDGSTIYNCGTVNDNPNYIIREV